MLILRLSALAEQDIENILAYSKSEFGESARLHYEALLETALYDLASDPDHASVRRRNEFGPSVRSYHLLFARDRAKKAHGIVRHPWHIVIFRISGNFLEIGRILHDAMEMEEHLPPEYRTPTSDRTKD